MNTIALLAALQQQALMQQALQNGGAGRRKNVQNNQAKQAQEALFQGKLADIEVAAKAKAQNELNGAPKANAEGAKDVKEGENGEAQVAEGDDKAKAGGAAAPTLNEQRIMAIRVQIEVLNAQFKKFELEYNGLIRKMGKEEKEPKQFSAALPLASVMGLKRGTLKEKYDDDVESLQQKMAGVLGQIAQLQSVIASLMAAGLPPAPTFAGFNGLG